MWGGDRCEARVKPHTLTNIYRCTLIKRAARGAGRAWRRLSSESCGMDCRVKAQSFLVCELSSTACRTEAFVSVCASPQAKTLRNTNGHGHCEEY